MNSSYDKYPIIKAIPPSMVKSWGDGMQVLPSPLEIYEIMKIIPKGKCFCKISVPYIESIELLKFINKMNTIMLNSLTGNIISYLICINPLIKIIQKLYNVMLTNIAICCCSKFTLRIPKVPKYKAKDEKRTPNINPRENITIVFVRITCLSE